MNNVRKPIRIPQDLRDTVDALHLDQATMDFFQSLWEYGNKAVLLPVSAEQIAVIIEYGEKFAGLFLSIETLKNLKKRFLILRPVIKEWAEKIRQLNFAEVPDLSN